MATKCHWLLLPGLSGVAVELGLSNLHTVGVKVRTVVLVVVVLVWWWCWCGCDCDDILIALE